MNIIIGAATSGAVLVGLLLIVFLRKRKPVNEDNIRSHAITTTDALQVVNAHLVEEDVEEDPPENIGVAVVVEVEGGNRKCLIYIMIGISVISVTVVIALAVTLNALSPSKEVPPTMAPTTVVEGIEATMIPTRKEVEWVQRGSAIVGETEDDAAGRAVSLSGDGTVLAVGNYGINGEASGHVRVYNWLDNEWIQQGFGIDGEAIGDQSGSAVVLSSDGSILAIAAFLNDGDGLNDVGHVRVFEWS